MPRLTWNIPSDANELTVVGISSVTKGDRQRYCHHVGTTKVTCDKTDYIVYCVTDRIIIWNPSKKVSYRDKDVSVCVNNCPKDATIYSFIIFLQRYLHISDDTLIHHQEHNQTIITSGTGRTVFATVRWRGGVGTVPNPPRQRTVASTVRPVPDVVITVWVCSWWWMRVFSETCRAVCKNIIKLYIVASFGQLLTLIHDARTHEHKMFRLGQVQKINHIPHTLS